MARYPIYASRERTSRAPSRHKQLLKHRNGILQSAQSIRFAGWTKNNFQAAVSSRPLGRLCIFSLDVESHDGGGEPVVVLSDGQELHLAALVNQLDDGIHAGALILLEGERTPQLEALLEAERERVQVIHAASDPHDVLFAFCCEYALFWDLESAIAADVSMQHLLECGLRLVQALEHRLERLQLDVRIGNRPEGLRGTAWRGGQRFASEADIDKMRDGARVEQQADTLKRIADAAATPRLEHQGIGERMVSSQGLFWLCELAHLNDVQDWLADTRFFRELFPYLLARPPASRFKFDRIRSLTAARHVLADLHDVPGGRYLVGCADESLNSEPPADLTTVEVPPFKIMRSLFPAWLWGELTGTPSLEGDCPATDVSYFDIREAADVMNSALTEADVSVRLNLPTEYQWEIAARGPQALLYPWGQDFDEGLCNCEMKLGHPSVCGTYSPNGDSPFGCSDMAGNVREWTRSYAGTRGVDWQRHHQDRVSNDPAVAPSSRMVLRGGSYSYDRACVQCWVRNTQIASRHDGQTGFRLIAELVQ